MRAFYVYLWLRENGTPYYVGKGTGSRVSQLHRVSRPSNKSLEIVEYYGDEQEAFEAEKFLISYYGRKDLGTGILRNMTDGGQGCTGLCHSESMKSRMSRARTLPMEGQRFNRLTVVERGPNAEGSASARWWCKCDCGNPKLTLVRRSSLISGYIKSCGCARWVWKDRTHTEATKQKLRLANLGKKWGKRSTPSPCKGIKRGPHSEECRRKMSQAWTPERREALIVWNRSRKGTTYK